MGVQGTFLSDETGPRAHPPSVVVYTDGGCDPNPGPGGWAAILCFPDRKVVLTGNAPDTTNNRMELEAAIAALAYLYARHGACQVVVHTDSEYVRLGITKWLKDWQARGWLTREKQAVKNRDLWQALARLVEEHRVRWRWVQGHAGDPLNERVDRLATEARSRLGRDTVPVAYPSSARSVQERAVKDGARVEISIASSCQDDTGHWAAVLRSGKGTRAATLRCCTAPHVRWRRSSARAT